MDGTSTLNRYIYEIEGTKVTDSVPQIAEITNGKQRSRIISMTEKKYMSIVQYYEKCLENYGDNHLGVGWTKRKEDVDLRYQVMLDVIKTKYGIPVQLLDFGCGASHLYEYILRKELDYIEYSGLDVSHHFLNISNKKYPHIKYYCLDILEDAGLKVLPIFDYAVMNGVFTVKRDISFENMFDYMKDVIWRIFGKVRKGMALNFMSKQVDWERVDLFHVPFDLIAEFLTKNISRNFIFRHDYGLYEYTVYVYKEPLADLR